MTSPYVTFPRQSARPVSTGWRVFRALLSAALLAAGVFGALVAAFIASILWSGCFIECTGDEPGDHLGGALVALAGVASLAAGPALVAWIYRSKTWQWVAVAAAGVGGIGALLVLGAS